MLKKQELINFNVLFNNQKELEEFCFLLNKKLKSFSKNEQIIFVSLIKKINDNFSKIKEINPKEQIYLTIKKSTDLNPKDLEKIEKYSLLFQNEILPSELIEKHNWINKDFSFWTWAFEVERYNHLDGLKQQIINFLDENNIGFSQKNLEKDFNWWNKIDELSFGNKNVGDIINYLIDSETSKPKIIKNYFEFVYYINDLRNVEILDVDDLIIQYKNYLLKLDLLNLIKDN